MTFWGCKRQDQAFWNFNNFPVFPETHCAFWAFWGCEWQAQWRWCSSAWCIRCTTPSAIGGRKMRENDEKRPKYKLTLAILPIYRKTHRNKLFFSSVDHLGKWWKIPRFLPFKLWILPYLILTGNPIERIRFIGKLEPFPNRFLVLWTPEKSANEAIHDFLLFNCIRILRISSSVSSFVSQICPFENALVNPNLQ